MSSTSRGRFQLAVGVGAALVIALGLLAGGGVTGYAGCGGGAILALLLVLDLLAE